MHVVEPYLRRELFLVDTATLVIVEVHLKSDKLLGCKVHMEQSLHAAQQLPRVH